MVILFDFCSFLSVAYFRNTSSSMADTFSCVSVRFACRCRHFGRCNLWKLIFYKVLRRHSWWVVRSLTIALLWVFLRVYP